MTNQRRSVQFNEHEVQVLREKLRSIQNEKDMASRKLQKQEAMTASSDKYLIQAKQLEAKLADMRR